MMDGLGWGGGLGRSPSDRARGAQAPEPPALPFHAAGHAEMPAARWPSCRGHCGEAGQTRSVAPGRGQVRPAGAWSKLLAHLSATARPCMGSGRSGGADWALGLRARREPTKAGSSPSAGGSTPRSCPRVPGVTRSLGLWVRVRRR